jgi:hypothetical protein
MIDWFSVLTVVLLCPLFEDGMGASHLATAKLTSRRLTLDPWSDADLESVMKAL